MFGLGLAVLLEIPVVPVVLLRIDSCRSLFGAVGRISDSTLLCLFAILLPVLWMEDCCCFWYPRWRSRNRIDRVGVSVAWQTSGLADSEHMEIDLAESVVNDVEGIQFGAVNLGNLFEGV